MARTTISLNDSIYKAGLKRAKALDYKKFSPYVEHLIRKDVEERPPHITVREEGDYRATSKPSGSSAA